jgi:hypothetical protein
MRVMVLECTASRSTHSTASAGGSGKITLATRKCLLRPTGCAAVHLLKSNFLELTMTHFDIAPALATPAGFGDNQADSFDAKDPTMQDDERCCGTGTCLINAEGYCWCGQKWNGSVMCGPSAMGEAAPASAEAPSAEPSEPS